MTRQEYQQAKEAIESKFRDDMAALDRVWVLLNGSQAPDGIVSAEDSERVTLRSAASLGIPTASEIDKSTAVRKRHTDGLSDEEKKAKKREYMRAYFAKRRAAGK